MVTIDYMNPLIDEQVIYLFYPGLILLLVYFLLALTSKFMSQ